MLCFACGYSTFRLSRFRSADIVRLALLQYPIRCRECHQRQYGSLLLALQLYQLRKVKKRMQTLTQKSANSPFH